MAQVGLDGAFTFELPEGWEAAELEDRPGFDVKTGREGQTVTVSALPVVPVPPEEVLNQVVSGLVGAQVLEETAGERPDGHPVAYMLLHRGEEAHRAHAVAGPSATVVVLGVHPDDDDDLAAPLAAMVESLQFEDNDTYVAEVVVAALEDHHPNLTFEIVSGETVKVTGKDGERTLDLSGLVAKVAADPEAEPDLIADYLETQPLG